MNITKEDIATVLLQGREFHFNNKDCVCSKYIIGLNKNYSGTFFYKYPNGETYNHYGFFNLVKQIWKDRKFIIRID